MLQPPTRRYLAGKRAVDILICTLLLVVVVPILLLCAIAIMIDSPGAPMFGQERTGRDGRRFKMLKLRTMVANAEELKPALASVSSAQ